VPEKEGQAPDWVVLEVPSAAEQFSAADLAGASVSRGELGQPVVRMEIRPERRNAFEVFTRRNVGLSLALVLDGHVLVSPVLRDALRDSVQITLGLRTFAELSAEASRLAATLNAARQGPLELLAVLEPGSPGRRRLRVPLGKRTSLPVRVKVADAMPRAYAASLVDRSLLGLRETAEVLLAAQATGQLRAAWADQHWLAVTRLDMGTVLLDLAGRAEDDELARADALELAALLDAEDPRVVAALDAAKEDPSPHVMATARFARARAERTAAGSPR